MKLSSFSQRTLNGEIWYIQTSSVQTTVLHYNYTHNAEKDANLRCILKCKQ